MGAPPPAHDGSAVGESSMPGLGAGEAIYSHAKPRKARSGAPPPVDSLSAASRLRVKKGQGGRLGRRGSRPARGGGERRRCFRRRPPAPPPQVVPAKAGPPLLRIALVDRWIPAFVGMTAE